MGGDDELVMKKFWLASAFILLAASASAQSVQQSGNITPGHAACWAITGVIFDCGIPGGGASVVGPTTTNDFVAFNSSGSLIDSGINPTSTSAWSGQQNFNAGITIPTRPPFDNTTFAANTAFVQSSTGFVPGATGDWNGSTGTDNTTALQNQLNANCSIRLLPGRYRLTAGLSTTCASVSILGSGVNTTELVFNGSISTGINIDHTSPSFNNFYSVQISDITIATTQVPGGTAIALTDLSDISVYREHGRMFISNVQIIGDAQYTQGWANGLLLTNTENVYIVNSNITGLGGDPAHQGQADLTKSSNGIVFTGAVDIPDEIHITNTSIFNFVNGINIGGNAEGVYVVNSTITNVMEAINWQAVGAPGGQLLIVGDSTFQAFMFGINVTSTTQVNIHDSLFLQDARALQDANEIQLVNVTKVMIHHNHFWSANAAFPVNGVVLGGSVSNADVLDNLFEAAVSGGIFFGVDVVNTNDHISIDNDPNNCIGVFAGGCYNVGGGSSNVRLEARVVDNAGTAHQWFQSVAAGVVTTTQPAFSDISGTCIVTQGCTGITSGTSGGIPYFSSTTTIASSALLAANCIVYGGGAATAPATSASNCPTVSSSGAVVHNSTTVLNGTTASNGTATFAAQLITTFGVPTIASGACGATTNGTVAGNNQAGVVTIGGAATTVCTVSFSTTITAPNSCVIFPGNATAAAQGTALAYVSSVGTTNFVITGSVLANTVYRFHCI